VASSLPSDFTLSGIVIRAGPATRFRCFGSVEIGENGSTDRRYQYHPRRWMRWLIALETLSMQPTRRSILRSIAACAVAAPALALAADAVTQSAQLAGDDGIILGAPLTHSDWMLKPGMDGGPAGVRHMLDACKAAGWTRVYWRTLDGGRSMYKSNLLKPGDKWDDDSFWSPKSPEDEALVRSFTNNMPPEKRAEVIAKCAAIDYGKLDSLAEAVKYGHQIGLQIHAWISINEDDHAWGFSSELARQQPTMRWKKRDGKTYHSQMSFAFLEVQAFKLAVIDEILAYGVDGLFIDWIRTGDIRDNPQTDSSGVADSGYEQPLVDSFKAKYGVDPHDVPNDDDRWVRHRAEPQTQFMRKLRQHARTKNVPVAVMVAHPWHYRGMSNKIDGNLRGLLLDVETWAKEGLMDSAVAAGYYRDGGNATLAYEALRKETGGKIDVWYFGWVPQTVAEFDRDFGQAKQLGAKEILYWEADYIDDRANAGELKAAMSKRSKS
jgi:hypothetical protein